MSKTQSLSNHARFDPLYHFFITGLYLVNLVYAGIHLHRQAPYVSAESARSRDSSGRTAAAAGAGTASLALTDLPPQREPVDCTSFCRRRRGGGTGQTGARTQSHS